MRRAATAVAAVLVASTAHAGAPEWHLDKAHTSIGFSVRHLGLSKVHGEFKEFDAVILADAVTGRITSVSATARPSSLDTGNEKRDAHLRGADFFAADRFPELRLVTKSIRWTGAKFTAKVDLTLRDVTKEVTFSGELLGPRSVDFGDGPQLRVGYSAKATLNRREFGLSFNRLVEGVAVVADEVELEIDLQASRRVGG